MNTIASNHGVRQAVVEVDGEERELDRVRIHSHQPSTLLLPPRREGLVRATIPLLRSRNERTTRGEAAPRRSF
jgi:hypothetical protein